MSYPLVQFVSAPSRDAVVRFDCNSVGEWSDDDRWPEHDGFTLGFPSLSGDPEAVGVQYGTRSIEFNLIIRATPDAAFGAFSRLSREVQRARNWLMVQFSDFSKPVWFYTYRTEQQALDFENVSGVDDTKRNVWGIGVRLAADPFAQGERVTLPAVTTFNNPFMAQGCVMRLPAILGDAPAPVRVQVTTTREWSGYKPLFSSIALDGGPYDGSPFRRSASGLASWNDVKPFVSDATYPGGGYVPIDFVGTNALGTRLTDTSTVLPMGTWRVLVWAAREGTADTFRLRTRRIAAGVERANDSVDLDRSASATAGFGTWMDLGIFSIPDGVSDDQASTYSTASNVIIDAQRLSGTGRLRVAAIMYLPVETPWSTESRTGSPLFGAVGLQTNQTAEWDEDDNYRVLLTSALPNRVLVEAVTPTPSGGMPVVVPGCTNTVSLVQQTNPHTPADPTDDNRDDVTATTTVTVSYAPRYLNLAGSDAL